MKLDNDDRTFIGVVKTVLYVPLWLTVAVAIYRGAVPTLWGSRSDFGLLAAVLVGLLAAVILLVVGYAAIKDIINTFTPVKEIVPPDNTPTSL